MVPTEAQEGEVLVAYLRVKGYKFTHIPNETGQSLEMRRRAIRMKRQGVSRGFPDYLVIVRGSHHATLVALELKRPKPGQSKVTPEQREWLQELTFAGVPCAICYGAKEAIEFIEESLL